MYYTKLIRHEFEIIQMIRQGESQDNIRWHRKIRHSTRSIDKMTPQHLYNLFLGVFLHSFNKTRKTGMKLF